MKMKNILLIIIFFIWCTPSYGGIGGTISSNEINKNKEQRNATWNNLINKALSMAVIGDDTDNVKKLLKAGADANSGKKPLLWKAIKNKNPVVVRLLLQYGAKIEDGTLITSNIWGNKEIQSILINAIIKKSNLR